VFKKGSDRTALEQKSGSGRTALGLKKGIPKKNIMRLKGLNVYKSLISLPLTDL